MRSQLEDYVRHRMIQLCAEARTSGWDAWQTMKAEMVAAGKHNVNEAAYKRAKAIMGELRASGTIEEVARIPRRVGIPGGIFATTDQAPEPRQDLIDGYLTKPSKQEAGESIDLFRKLTESKTKKLRIPMPCSKSMWRQVSSLGLEGKIGIIVYLPEEETSE